MTAVQPSRHAKVRDSERRRMEETGSRASNPLPSVALAKEGWKPYPAYKPSGVEWLGDVPEGWVVKRLRYVCRFAYGDSLAAEEREYGNVLVYGSNGPVGSHVVSNTRHPAIVIGRKGSHGKVNFSDKPAFAIDTTYFVDSRFTDADLRWLFYALGTVGLDAVSKDSAVPGLSREDAYANSLVVPPPAEQRAIADFLDRETGKIDRLVAKKRELIEKLKEERAALISRTVTRGLNPGAKLKTSGVEWLKDVPEGWEVVALKRTWVECEYGISESLSGDGPIRVLTMTHIQEGRVLLPENGCLDSVPAKMVLRRDDLLFNRTNSLAHVGKVGLFDSDAQDCTFASYLVRIRFEDMHEPRFFAFMLNTTHLLEFARCLALPSINQANLNPRRYGQIIVAVPPLPEQRVIADFLDGETSKIDRLAAKVEKAIARLQEYRAALITAAVTGKIDVRGEMAAQHTDKHRRTRTGTEAPLVYPAPQTELRMVAEGREP